ncbi:MAG: glycosyltransferase, partial [Geminicoccaceae bacterium]
MRRQLAIRGTLGGYSGYDITVRSFVRALGALGVDLELIDFPAWSSLRLPPAKLSPPLSVPNPSVSSSTIVQFCMPPQTLRYAGLRAINFTMFEYDRVPRAWLEHSLRQHHLVVPEESSRAAWLAEAFPPERISLCPLGVDCERFRPGLAPLPLDEVRGRPIGAYRTRFLNVASVIPRKNLLGLLRVWLDATRADDDAVLILKLSHSGSAAARLMRDLHFLERSLGRTRDQAAALLLLDPSLSDAEMPRLHANATHYWSMSHGEGWDQPMTEAAACGLRLIAPDHTAYRAYLDPSVATMLPCARRPARRPHEEDADPHPNSSQFTAEPQ